jgi:acyl carrier protein
MWMDRGSTMPLSSVNKDEASSSERGRATRMGQHISYDDIMCAVREFVANWRPMLPNASQLEPAKNLLESLDSFGFIELLLHLEKAFGVSIRTANMELSEIIYLDRLVAHVLLCAGSAAFAKSL